MPATWRSRFSAAQNRFGILTTQLALLSLLLLRLFLRCVASDYVSGSQRQQ